MPIAAWLADLVVIAHGLFIVFVVAGGLLVLRWPRAAWVHLPAAVWGVLIEWAGWICPLTPLENMLRQAAGQAGYSGGFVERYLLPLIYPAGLTPALQLWLGLGVLGLNAVIYALAWRRRRHHHANR
ncbi:DUF2784 domain-containing protein [Cupriavidus necator]|uniref:DUF2784 domain-containing protein n=1 Tax=Cupriavidus necator TaxID=106590 RepID=UPI0027818433|nr:DUF2784 domain-containing protein [Cupriavidus necator]MDQ0142788.1 hypothetical protein [Cupriavidus necator]